MILSVWAEVKLVPNNVKYWKSKGYDVGPVGGRGGKNSGSVLRVKVRDLAPGSNVMVTCRCDLCGREYIQRYCRNTDICDKPCGKRVRMVGNTLGSTNVKHEAPSRDILIQLHHVELLGRQEIARKCGVSGPVVDRWFKETSVTYLPTKDRKPPKEDLIKLHHTEKMTVESIAEKYGKAPLIVRRWLKDHNIEQLRHAPPPRIVMPSREQLHELHVTKKKTFKEISEIMGVSDVLVGMWCRELDIENIRYPSGVSETEDQIREYIKSLGIDAVCTRKIIPPRELDIFIEAHKIAFEYCGLWWHQEAKVHKDSHLKKLEACNDKGIRLITIFEDEWLEKSDIVRSLISSRLGKFTKTIDARKCDIVIDREFVADFLNQNHLQGRPANILNSVSLIHDNEIVACMTFGVHHRSRDKDIVLNRLCFKQGVAVRGGTEKMFKSARQIISGPIITWADRRWSEGEVYTRLGFQKDEVLTPDYWWCKGQVRKSKQSMKKPEECPEGITEREWWYQKGWYRVWDCGKIRFMYK